MVPLYVLSASGEISWYEIIRLWIKTCRMEIIWRESKFCNLIEAKVFLTKKRCTKRLVSYRIFLLSAGH